MSTKISLLFICLLVSFFSFGQKYRFQQFSINKGLPQSTVYSIIKDKRGFLWIGTEGGGVYKFDGKKGKIYNRSNGLPGNIVRSIFEDSKGNIWFGTDNGLALFNGYTFKNLNDILNLEGSTILDIKESANNKIWIGTNNKGLYSINVKTDTIRFENLTIADGLISNFIYNIHIDKKERIWLGMLGGITVMDQQNDSLKITKLSGGYELPDNFITAIEEGAGNRLWIGSYSQGIFYIDNYEDTDAIKVVVPENKILQSGTIWDIKKDSNGNIWLATDKNGIIKCSGNKTKAITTQNGLPTSQIIKLLIDDNNLWAGTMGHGAILYQGKNTIIFDKEDGIPSNNVISLSKTNQNKILIGTHSGLALSSIVNGDLKIDQLLLKNTLVKSIATDSNNYYVASENRIFKIFNNNATLLYQFDNEGTTINQILVDSKKNLWVATNNGYHKFTDNNHYNFSQEDGLINNEVQYIIEDNSKNIWMATLGGLVKINGANYQDFDEQEGLTNVRIHTLSQDTNGDIWIGSFGGGIFKLSMSNDSIPIKLMADQSTLTSNNIYSINLLNDSIIVAASDKGFDVLILNKEGQIEKNIKYYQGEGYLPGENNLNSTLVISESQILFGTIEGCTMFDINQLSNKKPTPVYITNIKLFFNDIDWDNHKSTSLVEHFGHPKKFTLNHNENHLTFENTAINFSSPNQITYSYRLAGQNDVWTPYTKNSQQVFSSLKPGSYSYQVKAKDKYGKISEAQSIAFTIKPPFWQTLWFYISLTLFVLVIITLYIRYRERKLKNEKIKLEKIVKERTAEVVKQKEEITDSISYASRIQNALLPNKNKETTEGIQSFVLFKPRDIVSGDFYWIDHIGKHSVYIAADCTGHGVPGAFMSMLGISFLNEIILKKKIVHPNEILNELKTLVKFALKQQGREGEAKDGMDVAACIINRETLNLEYSGAYNPVYIYRNNSNSIDFYEIKADRMPIGIHIKEKDSFTNHEFQLQKEDMLYIFSDGFVDQFGGTEGSKFKTKKFKNFLSEIQQFSIETQKELLLKKFKEWKGELDQVDDIIIIGMKIE